MLLCNNTMIICYDMGILDSNCSFALLKASNIFLDIFSVSASTADVSVTNRDCSICKVI